MGSRDSVGYASDLEVEGSDGEVGGLRVAGDEGT